MNAVEIEAAVSDLALQPFDGAEFPFAFLAAFGNKDTTIKRLRKGDSNASDVSGGVLQRNNIHIAVCTSGRVGETLKALRESAKTVSAKAKFILATDGETLEAEDLTSGETIASDYHDFARYFGFFLPLAGISTIKELKDNPIDVRATGRLNKLYIELLKDNPEWATEARRHDMNHFMARLIFCFFAEDTDIFNGAGLFTRTVEQMSARDSSNTHEVIGTVFLAMNVTVAERATAKLPPWADSFPYVNGGLFSGSTEVPRFSRIARTYLLHAGELNWREINPDIFGSMIQAVAEDEERGALGMHYTSVPNILKVLNPLFLDDLRAQLDAAGDNARMLLNLRKRMSRIRIFDPACGSGNFLVIAYKEMRLIEAEINRRRGEPLERTEIPLTNFRGIELRDFPAEIARLALVIAEYQCDVLYRGPLVAKAEFLPLDAMNWITCGNALRLDWLSICPPTGSSVKLVAEDLFETPPDPVEIDFKNEGGETYICGNPPYSGYNKQSSEQKDDLRVVFSSALALWGNLDYVAAWLFKASLYINHTDASAAFVMTNTICQGGQVAVLWPVIFGLGQRISFAYSSFKWANLASKNAGITVVIVGISKSTTRAARLFSLNDGNEWAVRVVENINAYLIPGENTYVSPQSAPLSGLHKMSFGNHPYYGAPFFLSHREATNIQERSPQAAEFIRPIYGSTEVISGSPRMCIWVTDQQAERAAQVAEFRVRFEEVRKTREAKTKDASAQMLANKPYRFRDQNTANTSFIAVPQTSSENREYLPCTVFDSRPLVTFKCFAMYDAPLWNMALIVSRLHWVWIGTVCARMRTDFSYSNTLGWNTYPVPKLTEQNKTDLTLCAEDILLAREAHFPLTIAQLYEADNMPENLRRAHEQNDEVLERIYIGRRFRNDTERLEKLFELHTKMTAAQPATKKKRKTSHDDGGQPDQ
jgi:hypothetical protein